MAQTEAKNKFKTPAEWQLSATTFLFSMVSNNIGKFTGQSPLASLCFCGKSQWTEKTKSQVIVKTCVQVSEEDFLK